MGCQRGHDGLPAPQHDLFVTDNDGKDVCDYSAFWIAKGSKTNSARFGILKVCGGLSLKKVYGIRAG